MIFLVLLVWLLYIFAHDRLMGFPDDPEKNVSLVRRLHPPEISPSRCSRQWRPGRSWVGVKSLPCSFSIALRGDRSAAGAG